MKKIALALILAATFPQLSGCAEAAAVQTLAVSLATPSPAPQVISITGDEETQADAKYGITVVSQYEGETQQDGTLLAEDGSQINLMATDEPTATPVLTPTPIPTAPPDTPTPTPSPEPTPSPTPTEKPKATATPKPTAKATPKATNTPKPTAKTTERPAGTATPKPEITPDGTFTVTPAPTAKPTAAPTTAPTATPIQTSSQQPPDVSGSYSGEDVLLAARVAYFESGRSEDGYRAVVCVILNRVESGKWPNSVNDVVYQKSQFSVVGRSDFLTKTIPDSVIGYANDVLNNGNRILPSNVMSFRSAATDKTWGTRTYYATYGGNDFYG